MDACVSAEEQQDVARGDMTAMRLVVTQETFEKDAAKKSCADLRLDVKRLDMEKSELSHVLDESKHKISGACMR